MEIALQIATLVGVVIGVVSLWLTKNIFRNQANVDVFLAYSERYAKVMAGFPENAWDINIY